MRTFCKGHLPEAAAGRPFRLVNATPGAAPLPEDDGVGVGDAGVAGAMLNVTWAD